MITEAAPLDALIQRFGRVNRRRTTGKDRMLKPVYVLPPYEDAKDALPYNAEIIKRSFEMLPTNEVLKERDIQELMDDVYADLDIKSIELAAFFKDGQFLIKELWHQPKSALIEQMDIETTSCITQEDWKNYGLLDAEERIKMEIPVGYKSIAFKGLDKEKRLGSRPYIVPDVAYDEHLGLQLKKAEPANYKTFEMI